MYKVKLNSKNNASYRYLAILVIVFAVMALLVATVYPFSVEYGLLAASSNIPNSFDIITLNITHFGSLAALYSASFTALILNRKRLAFSMLGGGVGAYLLAGITKEIIAQPRPHVLWPEIVAREWGPVSYGFPSGHAAVITAMVVTFWPYVHRRYRPWLVCLVAFVGISRVVLGMHFVIDVIGGELIGIIAGIIANRLFHKIKD